MTENAIGRPISEGVRKTGIVKRATPHAVQHNAAMHRLESGYDIRTGQELLGHANVETTTAYTHVPNRGGSVVKSPLDA